MNLSYLEIIIAFTSVVSSFYLVLQYLLRFQRKMDRVLILLAANSRRIMDVEKFLAKTTTYQQKNQIDENFLPELESDIL